MGQSLTDKIAGIIQLNIENGTWKQGEYIPPMRTIAQQENISRGVVNAAVSILVGKGMLERVPRHGIRVKSVRASDDGGNVRELAERCMEAVNKRRTGSAQSYRTEDVKILQDCFRSILEEELEAARNNRSSTVSPEEAMLYDKGLRCAGWSPDRYTLYRCNLTEEKADLMRGNLLNFSFDQSDVTFDDRTMDYVEKRVHPNDSNDYLALLNSRTLIKKSAESDFYSTIEYREKLADKYRWVRLSVNIAKAAEGKSVVLYLLYQDIDDEKRNELMLKERTDEDALTGALNRRAFMLQSEQLLLESDESRQHAFLMLDIDGFKSINDTFGHPVGDTVLSDLSKVLHTILRHGDLLGRIGGDEFMICLKDIPFDAVIEKKARQINDIMRRDFEQGTSISGSIGIALFPRDGKNYDQIYSRADIALYHAKENGKNRFVFYREGMARSESGISVIEPVDDKTAVQNVRSSSRKKILVVDDADINRKMLAEMLKDDYTVLQAKDGRRALLTLRRYGTGISAVLLDLVMPRIDGFEVLRCMQREPILKSIPVIVVSGAAGDNTEFRAIEMGAMDFVSKPVDRRILKLRVKNCVNKQENERLRIQNSYLQLQGDEEQRYRLIIQHTGTVAIELDWANNVFIYDKCISLYLAGKYDHRPLWRILLSDMVANSADVKALQKSIYKLANSHSDVQSSLRLQLKSASGEKHWFEMNAIKIVDEFNIATKFLITLNDINNDVLVENRLRNLVEFDSLTGLYNRTAFLERSSEIIVQNKPDSWMLSLVDIDKFKVFNHLYGHDEGDKVLIHLAKQLSMFFGRFGAICGRIQSDTFAVLHPARKECIESLTTVCSRALNGTSATKRIAFCTGRCYIDDISTSINSILDKADIALRMAKTSVSGDVTFTENMQRRLLHDQRLVSDMELALATESFCLYFQPIYEYNSNRIITAEALVRWITKEKKIIPPDEFIPLFEQNGFIVKLDAYVWERACIHIREWLDMGIDIVPISVNVSRMDMYSGRFVETITSITNKHNVPPSLLRLEITESAYIADSQQMISQVEQLQRLGYIIEMDDFGSGFSSLNILSEVPVDILKLDMKFVAGNDLSSRKSKIMGHIINMARSSDIDVIAEGVETREQADFLDSLGCTNMQGYYFSHPVHSTDFIKFFQPAV